MLMDAIKYLVGLGRESAAIQQTTLPGGRVVTLYGDTVDVSQADAVPIGDKIWTLKDLIKWIVDKHENVDDPECDVMVGPGHIVVKVNRDLVHVKVSAVMSLEHSKPFNSLNLLCTDGMPHKAFVRALRGPLYESFDEKWLAIFRRIDFKRSASSMRDTSNTGDKLGRSVETAAQSAAGEIPESILFTVPIYSIDERALVLSSLRIGIEVDPDTEMIRGIPAGDCVDEALREAKSSIVEYIRDNVPDTVRVYSGSM